MPTVRTTKPEPAFLGGEDVLDARAHPGPGGIAAGDMRRHLLAPRLFALELRLQPAAVEQGQVGRRAVGGVGPHLAGGVVAIEHGAELTAVVSRRVGDGVAAHKAVLAIDADVVLVAEHRHRDLELPLVAARRGVASRLRPRLMVQRPSRSICARRAGFHSAGTPPPLIVSFSAWVSRGRRASITVASTICPPIASQPLARSNASNRANNRSAAPARASCSRYSQIVLASGTGSCSASPTNRINDRWCIAAAAAHAWMMSAHPLL